MGDKYKAAPTWSASWCAEDEMTAAAYRKANEVLRRIKYHGGDLTAQEYKSLREQAIAGDVEGAWKRLQYILAAKGRI